MLRVRARELVVVLVVAGASPRDAGATAIVAFARGGMVILAADTRVVVRGTDEEVERDDEHKIVRVGPALLAIAGSSGIVGDGRRVTLQDALSRSCASEANFQAVYFCVHDWIQRLWPVFSGALPRLAVFLGAVEDHVARIAVFEYAPKDGRWSLVGSTIYPPMTDLVAGALSNLDPGSHDLLLDQLRADPVVPAIAAALLSAHRIEGHSIGETADLFCVDGSGFYSLGPVSRDETVGRSCPRADNCNSDPAYCPYRFH